MFYVMVEYFVQLLLDHPQNYMTLINLNIFHQFRMCLVFNETSLERLSYS